MVASTLINAIDTTSAKGARDVVVGFFLHPQDQQKLKEALIFANGHGAITKKKKKGAILVLPDKSIVLELLKSIAM
ncbi:hypothetical protein SUGI_0932580 [Cryptomeria japonica]|nr:hypothetical protein SUGI_0932580 [Cryptomeria japonica]